MRSRIFFEPSIVMLAETILPEISGLASAIDLGLELPPPCTGCYDEAGRVLSAVASRREITITGWALPLEGSAISGIRLKGRKGEYRARRKQLRPDVASRFPAHPNALFSGFTCTLKAPYGRSEFQIECKLEGEGWARVGCFQVERPRFRMASGKKDFAWLAAAIEREEGVIPESPGERAEQGVPEVTVWPVGDSRDGRSLGDSVALMREQLPDGWECVEASEPYHVGALAKATGTFTLVLEPGVVPAPGALRHIEAALRRHPEADLVFTDTLDCDPRGRRRNPRLRGGWNRELLQHEDFLRRACLCRSSLLQKAAEKHPTSHPGELPRLLALENPGLAAVHIPRALFHLPVRPLARKEALASGLGVEPPRPPEAVPPHLSGAIPLDQPSGGCAPSAPPHPTSGLEVSIIIPTRDQPGLLERTVRSLESRTASPSWEVILLDHGSSDPDAVALLASLPRGSDRFTVHPVGGEFNWARFNNLGADRARGRLLVFLNNDMEIVGGDWLAQLAAMAMRAEAGAVGARLLYPDGAIQHAGVVLGMSGVAGHVFRGLAADAETVAGSPARSREVSAVTGACMAVRSKVFREIGGFDEETFAVNYNDVDFCLKASAMGYHNYYCAASTLIHHESATRAADGGSSAEKDRANREARALFKRWGAQLARDRFFHPLPELARHERPPVLPVVLD